jgi:DNA-directed RNA polymerase specialized sigma24 family protein
MDDTSLVRACLDGDEAAWAELRGLVERLARGLAAPRFGLDPQQIQDVVQATLVELLDHECRALRTFKGRSCLSTYLATFVLRVAARLHHGHGSLAPGALGLLEEPLKATDRQTSSVEVWAVIEQVLPLIDLLILHLGAAGYTADEIAAMLSRLHSHPWRAEAVRQRKSRAIRRVRQVLCEGG